jgi:molybdopterin-guanine dinucleotide biosynthesis protein A
VKRLREPIRRRNEPVGVLLAGGLGRRMGGSKATVALGGRPLICYPLDALTAALKDVVIVAKAETELPSLPDVRVWIEPDQPRDPLLGIVYALEVAQGRAVLACAGDLPFVSPELIRSLARCDPAGAAAVIASRAGQLQPLLGCYQPGALRHLSRHLADGEQPLREVVGGLSPRLLEILDPDALFNVNAPDDLLQAAAMLDQRRAHPR